MGTHMNVLILHARLNPSAGSVSGLGLGGWLSESQGAIEGRCAQAVALWQASDRPALHPQGVQVGDIHRGEHLLPPKVRALGLRRGDTFALALRSQFSFELGDDRQHAKE